MSDTPQGDGWWQASDGKWYPPAQQPGGPPPSPGATPGAVPGQQPGGVPGQQGDQDKPKRGWLIALLIVLLLLIAAGVGAFFVLSGDDDADGGGGDDDGSSQETDIGDATGDLPESGKIEFDTDYEDKLEGSRTEAHYTLDAPDGAIMTLTVTNEKASKAGVFTTFESGGQRFASFRVNPGGTETATIVLDAQGGAPFELNFTEGPAAFEFRVDLDEPDDAGSGTDAGADVGSALAVDAGQKIEAMLGGEDQVDHYTLQLQPGTELTMDASVDREAERGVFFVVQLAGQRLFSERVAPGSETSWSLLLSDQDSGELEIVATEGPADYSFTVDFTEQQEGGQAGDAPAELGSARTIEIGGTLEGQVGDRDQGDYYLFTASAATLQLTASATAESARAFSITIEDDSGSRLKFFRVEPGTEKTETVEVTPGSTVRLIVGEGRGKYSITLG